MSEPTRNVGASAHGRVIVLEVGRELDEAGQFVVRLVVDGKERWAAWFTDKSEES